MNRKKRDKKWIRKKCKIAKSLIANCLPNFKCKFLDLTPNGYIILEVKKSFAWTFWNLFRPKIFNEKTSSEKKELWRPETWTWSWKLKDPSRKNRIFRRERQITLSVRNRWLIASGKTALRGLIKTRLKGRQTAHCNANLYVNKAICTSCKN